MAVARERDLRQQRRQTLFTESCRCVFTARSQQLGADERAAGQVESAALRIAGQPGAETQVTLGVGKSKSSKQL